MIPHHFLVNSVIIKNVTNENYNKDFYNFIVLLESGGG